MGVGAELWTHLLCVLEGGKGPGPRMDLGLMAAGG